jgi:hypothetical protein
MSKVGEIIAAALREIRVIDPEQNPEPTQYQTAIESLNRMVVEWEVDNMALGWVPVASPDDDLPAEPAAESAIVSNLAVRLRRQYGANVDGELIEEAKESYARLLRLCMVRAPIVQPSILPLPASEFGVGYSIING